jgi:hypothetical protein
MVVETPENSATSIPASIRVHLGGRAWPPPKHSVATEKKSTTALAGDRTHSSVFNLSHSISRH